MSKNKPKAGKKGLSSEELIKKYGHLENTGFEAAVKKIAAANK